jgi:hypothetical protein
LLRTKETFENLEAFPNMIAGRMAGLLQSHLIRMANQASFCAIRLPGVSGMPSAGKSGFGMAAEAMSNRTLELNA